MKNERSYSRCLLLARIIFGSLYRVRVTGSENIKPGGGLVCAMHSSAIDPIFLAIAFGSSNRLCFMAKAELFAKKATGRFLSMLGAFPVDRAGADVKAIITTMKLLKSGEKVVLFPEGTRIRDDAESSAKLGAVRIADRTDSLIYPVYLPRTKKLFRRLDVIIGEPYKIAATDSHRTGEDYDPFAKDLMERIYSLRRD